MSKHTQLRAFALVARYELKMLVAERMLPVVCGLLALMIGYAFFSGLALTQVRDDAVAAALQKESKTAVANLESLRKVTAGIVMPGPFENPANPAMIGNGSGRQAVLPSLALAPIAIGQSDMMPNAYRIGTQSKVEFMYDSEVESPWTLLSGHFDLAFVIVFLLPLLIFALSYNLLSAEREAGTQRLLLSQPLSLAALVAGKLAARALPLLSVAALLPIALLLVFRPEARTAASQLWIWIGLVVAYGSFWFALALAVNALRLPSATNALALIAAWSMLVLIVPVLVNLAAGALSPAPSRTELAIRTRAAQADNLRRYDDLFSGDYRYIDEPDSLLAKDGRIEIPPRTRASFLARRDLDARIDALLADFDRQAQAQQRVVDSLGAFSPAITMYEALTATAGTNSARYVTFRQTVSQFHDGWRAHFQPLILNGVALREPDLKALPAWRWREPARDDGAARIGLLLGLTGLAAGFGAWRLRRYAVAG
jgi:ABC-2 type transport system permease protein